MPLVVSSTGPPATRVVNRSHGASTMVQAAANAATRSAAARGAVAPVTTSHAATTTATTAKVRPTERVSMATPAVAPAAAAIGIERCRTSSNVSTASTVKRPSGIRYTDESTRAG